MPGPGPDRNFFFLGPDRKNTSFFFKRPDRIGRSGPVPGRFSGFRSKTPCPNYMYPSTKSKKIKCRDRDRTEIFSSWDRTEKIQVFFLKTGPVPGRFPGFRSKTPTPSWYPIFGSIPNSSTLIVLVGRLLSAGVLRDLCER